MGLGFLAVLVFPETLLAAAPVSHATKQRTRGTPTSTTSLPAALPGVTAAAPLGTLASLLSLHQVLDAFASTSGNSMGHSGNLPEQTRLLFELVRAELPAALPAAPAGLVLCEIGFNVGHSAATFLSAAAAKGAKVRAYNVFDMDENPSVRQGYEHLRSVFSETAFSFMPGDSAKTLPAWTQGPAAMPCDMFHIDGAHAGGGPALDWANVRRVIRADGSSLVVFDDCGCQPGSEWWCKEPEEVFDAAVAAGDMVSVSKGVISLPSKGTCAGRGKAERK
jgi:hypothetical protein